MTEEIEEIIFLREMKLVMVTVTEGLGLKLLAMALNKALI